MDYFEALKDIGFHLDEAKVYVALLEGGESLASTVAERANLNRSLVYQILNKLVKKGVASYIIKNNIRYYMAIGPEKLLEILKEKEERIREAIPELKSLMIPRDNTSKVEILQGREGIKTVLKDILKVKEDWLAFGSGRGPQLFPYYVEHWEKERVKKKILLKAILGRSLEGKKRGSILSKLQYTSIKYSDEYSNPASIWIYGGRLSIVLWNEDNSFAIRVINKEIVESFKNYFNLLWKQAKK